MAALSGKMGALYARHAYVITNDKAKMICDFQSDETWVSVAGTQSTDTTNVRLGTQSIRITEDDDTAGALFSTRSSLAINLTTFESGDASTTADYIVLYAYVSDASKVASISFVFDGDSTVGGGNYATYEITSGFTSGWNAFKVKKSSFTINAPFDWSTVGAIEVRWTSGDSASGAYVSFQTIYLVANNYDIALFNGSERTMVQAGLFYNWSLEASVDMGDITEFGAGWKSNLPMLKEFTVSAEKFWDSGDYLTNLGTEYLLSLYTSTTSGHRYECVTKLNSGSIETSVDDLVNESIEFTGSGELLYTNGVVIG